jgi:hypothetical protein
VESLRNPRLKFKCKEPKQNLLMCEDEASGLTFRYFINSSADLTGKFLGVARKNVLK